MRGASAALVAALAAQVGVSYLAVASVLGEAVQRFTRPQAWDGERLLDD